MNDPRLWRDRAQRTRTLANRRFNEGEKQRLLKIATEYDRLAERAEQLATPEVDKKPDDLSATAQVQEGNSNSPILPLRKVQ